MVATTEGYELKGLAYPGRDVNFDSNSQVPSGHHNGRTIYYVFGRYPKEPDGDTYPVIDLNSLSRLWESLCQCLLLDQVLHGWLGQNAPGDRSLARV